MKTWRIWVWLFDRLSISRRYGKFYKEAVKLLRACKENIEKTQC